MPRKLTREGEPTQRTPGGLEIPIPTRAEFDQFLKGIKRPAPKPSAKARKRRPSASARGKGKRRTSRAGK